jgi:hypothetical protein
VASKDKELHYLQILQEKLKGFPEGTVVSDEEPDFLVSTHEGLIGIEVRQIFKVDGSPLPMQVLESEARIIVARAQEAAVNRNLPGLAVAVKFSPCADLRKSAREANAIELLEIIANHVPELGGYVALIGDEPHGFQKDLPSFVSYLRIFHPLEPCPPFWVAQGGGWIQTGCIELLAEAIESKNKRLPTYLKKCSRCWLLLAADGLNDSNLIQPYEESFRHIYRSLFDRTFYLEAFSRSVMELNTSKDVGGDDAV